MTKSKKRKQAEQKKAEALAQALPVRGTYIILEIKSLGRFPVTKGLPKPSPSIASGLTQWPAQEKQGKPSKPAEPFFVPLAFPCAKVILLNTATGRQTKIVFTKATDAKYTVHAPFKHKKAMTRTQFLEYARDRLGLEGLAEVLEAVALQG